MSQTLAIVNVKSGAFYEGKGKLFTIGLFLKEFFV